MVGAPQTSDIVQLLVALVRDPNEDQKGHLRMQIESRAANVSDSTPKVNVSLDRLEFAIHNKRYDDGDEEIIEDDDDDDNPRSRDDDTGNDDQITAP